ncbi:probable lysophospholipase BODYGUARD 3 isoform X2 [Telopea speciosissima]|uniref:probable lysophospholipase BODYGUARD 3 isoform X2 n=1 Tax=Telopea speciosissima TaxID=54955 RepID=UPI001CC3458D|nr:probable lysophospholipase BODYGUARD 3 isoform X2 [Telopea speciosissima]
MGGLMVATRSVLMVTGRVTNDVVSFIVFTLLDLLDVLLCVLYKLTDLLIEAEWKPCYCSSAKEAITSSGKILVSEQGESKIVCLSSSKLQWEDLSDTLYSRPSLVSDLSKSTVKELKRLKIEATTTIRTRERSNKNGTLRSTFTINSTIVEMLQGKIGGQRSHPIPRWSDCDCITCTSWSSSSSCKETLFVRAEGPKDKSDTGEDVLFIHGFISSSKFWTETVFPNFSREAKSKYRLIAVDLLGFGRSPKPTDSLYTLREHVEMIQRSVLEPYKVKSFHIVAHSLGCILALALAVNHPGAVKSLTLLAPPYFPVPKGEAATQYVLRKVAPRRVWPPIAFGASIACWYEHISRTICLLICKNHRLWEFLTKLVTRNRIRTYMMEGFFCHTHNAAWHTLHNIICGSAGKVNEYLDAVRERLDCEVTIFHGSDDELLPVDCSYAVQTKIPRARVKVIEKKDHITIVVGRQKAFARELEEIWKKKSSRG